ncbi:MAG: class I SAM-dependent rRNA methyltransferase [Desulfuromonadales bacterium]|nr:class I SAM-dependent rRNA methyltransferase [Desulfuromonadales bacterium]
MQKKEGKELPRLVVGPETVRMLELGHPWVIADRFTKSWPKHPAGTVATLVSGAGEFVATALLDPYDRIVARILARKPMTLDRAWLGRQIDKAVTLRVQHARLEGTSAYRLINGEGDGLPGVTIDRYGDHLLLQLYSEAWRPHLPLLSAELQARLSPAGIYEKTRPRETRELGAQGGKKYSRLLGGRPAPGRSVVQENGLNFLVDLEEGLNTGLFLDQRRNRLDLMERVRGKRVLNLFAYTGAFSVAAAASGATQVSSVDVSAPYLDWAQANFRANRLDPKRHEFLTGDCFAVLATLRKARRSFDIIVTDPPSFSTTSKSRFTTRQGTAEVVAAALPLLAPGGLLITCSNHQKVDLPDYLKELRRGALQAGSELRVIQTLGQPEDFPYPVTFPEGRYLKYVIAVRD